MLNAEEMYELVYEAMNQAMQDRFGDADTRIAARFAEGKVIFEDSTQRTVKEIPVQTLFRKVTSVREKLRVLEQKINNNKTLTGSEKADYQTLLTRCYGSLTSFNLLFRNEEDKFKGTGG
ncbi:MAG: hypothetical protein HN348_02700 [Proteobacteria bacterium]|jgi:hypothetical protein|nr:hypothetical protein [Pseudomonadota bacterium]